MSPALFFLAAFAVCLVLDVAYSLVARGEVRLSVLGLVFGPMLLAGAGTLLVFGALELRAGRWVGLLPWAACAVLAWLMGSGAIVRHMMFPAPIVPGIRLPASGTELAPGATSLDYPSEDGLALRGIVVRARPDAPRRGAIVYFHGNGEVAAWNLDTAQRFAAVGFDVFVAEYRGYGGCAGSPHEAGLLADGRGAVAAAREAFGTPPGQLLLVGCSLGTSVASAMAAEGHGRGLMLLAPFTSIVDVAAGIVPPIIATLAVRDRLDSRARLADSTFPVRIIHGTADRVVPFALGQRLSESLGERCRFFPQEGVGHNDLWMRAGPEIVAETARLADETAPRGE